MCIKKYVFIFVAFMWLFMASFVSADNFKLLIKIPTRSRPKQFFSCLDKYYENLSNTLSCHFLITCDIDDSTMNNPQVIERLIQYKNLKYSFGVGVSKIEAYNRDVNDNLDFDVLVVTSDDFIPVQKNYDLIIRDKMLQYFPDMDGVLQFYDGNCGNAFRINTYPIIGKKYYDRFGYTYHPFYKTAYCDDEVTLISHALGKCADFPKILLFAHCHNGASLDKSVQFRNCPNDELYKRNDAEELSRADYFLFNARKQVNFHIDGKTQKVIKLSLVLLIDDQVACAKMYQDICQQLYALGLEDSIEILFKTGFVTVENYMALLQKARGEYICFVDQRFDLKNMFVQAIVEGLSSYPDFLMVPVSYHSELTKYPLIFMRYDAAVKNKFCNQKAILQRWIDELTCLEMLKNRRVVQSCLA